MLIRQVNQEDIAACTLLERTCFSPKEAASEERIALRQREFPQGFVVAEVDGEVIGMINSGASDHVDLADENFKALVGHYSGSKCWVIFSLAVAPVFQNRGIAQKLLSAYFEQARLNQATTIKLLCKCNLISFYERLGFKNMGQSLSQHGGEDWWEMCYSLAGCPT